MLTVLGLFGMHDLPDAVASSGSAMTTSMTMPVPVDTTSTHTYAPMGCAMDHTNCVAVQREPGNLAHPGAVLTTATRNQPRPSPSAAPFTAHTPRAPPNVSLVELGISRT